MTSRSLLILGRIYNTYQLEAKNGALIEYPSQSLVRTEPVPPRASELRISPQSNHTTSEKSAREASECGKPKIGVDLKGIRLVAFCCYSFCAEKLIKRDRAQIFLKLAKEQEHLLHPPKDASDHLRIVPLERLATSQEAPESRPPYLALVELLKSKNKTFHSACLGETFDSTWTLLVNQKTNLAPWEETRETDKIASAAQFTCKYLSYTTLAKCNSIFFKKRINRMVLTKDTKRQIDILERLQKFFQELRQVDTKGTLDSRSNNIAPANFGTSKQEPGLLDPHQRWALVISNCLSFPEDTESQHWKGIKQLGGLLPAMALASCLVHYTIAWQMRPTSRYHSERRDQSHKASYWELEPPSSSEATKWKKHLCHAMSHWLEVDIRYKDFGDSSMKACLLETPKRRVAFISERLSTSEQCWALMHELGHIVLSHRANSEYGLAFSRLDRERKDEFLQQEHTANAFATLVIYVIRSLWHLWHTNSSLEGCENKRLLPYEGGPDESRLQDKTLSTVLCNARAFGKEQEYGLTSPTGNSRGPSTTSIRSTPTYRRRSS